MVIGSGRGTPPAIDEMTSQDPFLLLLLLFFAARGRFSSHIPKSALAGTGGGPLSGF